MTVLGIALRSLRQRTLSTVLTAVSVGLGVALVLLVFQLKDTSRKAFDGAARGYDVVLGGVHTSPLTTVLSTIFHADKPTDVIPIEAYEAVRKDPRVKYAVPYAVGDVYRGYRVVATTGEFFDAIEDAAGRPLREVAKGGVLDDADEFGAVVGGIAASRNGLAIGSQIRVTHGITEPGHEGHEHAEVWTVRGILPATGTPNDRAVFITLKSFFHIAEHHPEGAKDDDHDGKDEPKVWAVSSIVVRLKIPATRFQFIADMKKRADVQPAWPPQEISRLFDIVKEIDALFGWIGWLVLLVSGISILVGLWNAMEGRRREIAILRALGATPAHVFSVVVLEAVLVCLLGGAIGLALGHAAVVLVAPMLLDLAGIRITPEFGLADLWTLLGLAAMGVVTGALPAWRAFRTPVAANLHPVD